jgi:hypothetical protein
MRPSSARGAVRGSAQASASSAAANEAQPRAARFAPWRLIHSIPIGTCFGTIVLRFRQDGTSDARRARRVRRYSPETVDPPTRPLGKRAGRRLATSEDRIALRFAASSR